MKKEIADIWVKALRSGDYKQGWFALHVNDKFCCLGILCDIAHKERVVKNVRNNEIGVAYDFNGKILPESVMKWAGMHSRKGEFKSSLKSLIDYNDHGASFQEIADIIEKRYTEL